MPAILIQYFKKNKHYYPTGTGISDGFESFDGLRLNA